MYCVQIFSQANTSVKRWLLNFAAKRKGAEVSRGVIRCDSIWDKIFFHKIQVCDLQRVRHMVPWVVLTGRHVDVCVWSRFRPVWAAGCGWLLQERLRPLHQSWAFWEQRWAVRSEHHITSLCVMSYCDVLGWCSWVCLQVYEAYGQTECTAGCTFTTPGDWTSGEICIYKKETKLPMCFPALKSMND